MLDSIAHFLSQPVQLWHLGVVAIGMAASFRNIESRLDWISKMVVKTWDRLEPSGNHDE